MNIQLLRGLNKCPFNPKRGYLPPSSTLAKSGNLLSIILAVLILLPTSFANADYDDYDYIDIGAPLKELMQNNFSAFPEGPRINQDGDVIFYLRDNANPLIDIYRYRSASDSLQAQGVSIPEGNYFSQRTFDLNDNGLIIFGQGQQSPNQQLMVKALTPAGVLETRMTLMNISNTSMPFNINNHDQMVARTFSDTLGYHLVISDGPDTRTRHLQFDPYTQTMTQIYPVTGDSGDVVFGHNMRSGGLEFNWYNLSTDQLETWVEPDIGGVFGIDINDAGLAVVTAQNVDGTYATYLQLRRQTVSILESNAEYSRFSSPPRINNRNQVLVSGLIRNSSGRLIIVEPQISASGEIIGPPQDAPQLVFDNTDGEITLTTNGQAITRAEVVGSRSMYDFNDRGEVVFIGRVCDPSTYQDCYYSTILARPKHLSPTNLAPTADAGADQSIRAGESVQLDGSGSFDDNTPTSQLDFSWAVALVPEGSVVTEVGGSHTAHPTLTTDLPGVYKIRLQVSDEQGLTSDYDEVVVSTDNLAPTADAGPDALVLVGTQVMLDGQASNDPESDPLNYQWQWISTPPGSAAMLNGAETVMASFIADEEGDYVVRLTVSDPFGAGPPDSATITAIRADEFAKMEVMQANELVVALDPEQVTTGGNQQALSNFMRQVNAALNVDDTEEAMAKLRSAIRRVDGCALRDAPDRQGKDRDWITDCEAQKEVYAGLDAALQSLQQAQ